jgi:hypothetical protein
VITALADIGYSGEFTMESDSFLAPYPEDFIPTAAKYMADTTQYLADRLEWLINEKKH